MAAVARAATIHAPHGNYFDLELRLEDNMAESETNDRCLLIRSRLSGMYQLSEFGMKNLQHVLTDWFPRAVHADLTDDTASVDIEVVRDTFSGRSVLNVVFKDRAGGTIKRAEYPEDRLIGKTCAYYDAKKAKYDGKEEGYDRRLVFYSPVPLQRA
jgi:hypothetical protein